MLMSDARVCLQAPLAQLEKPLTVAGEACQLLKAGTASLSKLVAQLQQGELNFCIVRGCIRSLQDVLMTLVRHLALLLRDMMLRLDCWSDPADTEWRAQVWNWAAALPARCTHPTMQCKALMSAQLNSSVSLPMHC